MFLLNPGRYVVADPLVILKESTFKRLWASSTRFDSHMLETPCGLMLSLPTGKSGSFHTDQGRMISTETGHIAFVPYMAAEKLLPREVIRVSLTAPAMLFFDADCHIVLDGCLTIFC